MTTAMYHEGSTLSVTCIHHFPALYTTAQATALWSDKFLKVTSPSLNYIHPFSPPTRVHLDAAPAPRAQLHAMLVTHLGDSEGYSPH